jgi:hypothetical protein
MRHFEYYTTIGACDIDWSTQGDEWLSRFRDAGAAASPEVTVGGVRLTADTGPFVEVLLRSGGTDLSTLLLVLPLPNQVVFFAASDQPPDFALVSQLGDTVSGAIALLGTPGSDHAWTAIIGNIAKRVGGMEKRLNGEATVGPFRIASSGQVFHEPGQTSFHGWSLNRSVPMLVEGSSRGYSSQVAMLAAARDLSTLCGLLSVAWDAGIGVRDGPAPLEWGPRSVPNRPGWYAPNPQPEADEDEPGELVTVPEWVQLAWERVTDLPWLRDALDAFQEGEYATHDHPSLAAVSFTTTIEVIAGRVFERNTCPQCGTQFGIARGFRSALRIVLPEAEASELDPIYAARSRTVHRGQLHGGETTRGVEMSIIWGKDTSNDFRWRMLFRLRQAARLLLLRALMNDLPEVTATTASTG